MKWRRAVPDNDHPVRVGLIQFLSTPSKTLFLLALIRHHVWNLHTCIRWCSGPGITNNRTSCYLMTDTSHKYYNAQTSHSVHVCQLSLLVMFFHSLSLWQTTPYPYISQEKKKSIPTPANIEFRPRTFRYHPTHTKNERKVPPQTRTTEKRIAYHKAPTCAFCARTKHPNPKT